MSVTLPVINSNRTIDCKVGDRVIVHGFYAESSQAETASYYKAIGWFRRVVRIIPDANFPILFGDDKQNPTGWIKGENLRFINRGSFGYD